MSDGLLNDHVPGHSTFQIEWFITALNGVTPWGKYTQAMRELAARRDTLDSAVLNLEAIDIRTARVRSVWRRVLSWVRPFGRRLLALRIARVAMERDSIVQGIADTKREAAEFKRIVRKLKEEIGELTPERREQLDVEMWVQRIALRAWLENETLGGISYNTREILALADPEWRERVERMAGLNKALPSLDANGKARFARRITT